MHRQIKAAALAQTALPPQWAHLDAVFEVPSHDVEIPCVVEGVGNQNIEHSHEAPERCGRGAAALRCHDGADGSERRKEVQCPHPPRKPAGAAGLSG